MESLPITNHIDKCGKRKLISNSLDTNVQINKILGAKVNESCFFNEQCESLTPKTECRDGVCQCRFDQQAVIKSDGTSECIGK